MTVPAVYLMASKPFGTLYVGVTRDLIRRIYEHKNDVDKRAFTCKYKVHSLVYYEFHADMGVAIDREKALKGTNRNEKIRLIREMNPAWLDLYNGLL